MDCPDYAEPIKIGFKVKRVLEVSGKNILRWVVYEKVKDLKNDMLLDLKFANTWYDGVWYGEPFIVLLRERDLINHC